VLLCHTDILIDLVTAGNSGGPVVNDAGQVVGVAFQSLEGDDVENIGYVVPVNVLQHFLEDVDRHGEYYCYCW
jgi:S1-C subfamily serine protease